MKKSLKYSVLEYSPSASLDKETSLGILFSEESIGYRFFYHVEDPKIIAGLDDKLSNPAIKEFLLGIEEEVSDRRHENSFNMERFIKYYINDYKFDTPQTVEYDDLDTTIAELIKTNFS